MAADQSDSGTGTGTGTSVSDSRIIRFFKLPFMKMLRTAGMACGGASIAVGIVDLFTSLLSPSAIIWAIYQILFGIMMIVCEMRWKKLLGHFKFLTHFVGLGAFYFFVALLIVNNSWWEILVAVVEFIVGSAYIVLGCMGLKMGAEELPEIFRRNKATNGADESESKLDTTFAVPPEAMRSVEPKNKQVSSSDVFISIPSKNNNKGNDFHSVDLHATVDTKTAIKGAKAAANMAKALPPETRAAVQKAASQAMVSAVKSSVKKAYSDPFAENPFE